MTSSWLSQIAMEIIIFSLMDGGSGRLPVQLPFEKHRTGDSRYGINQGRAESCMSLFAAGLLPCSTGSEGDRITFAKVI